MSASLFYAPGKEPYPPGKEGFQPSPGREGFQPSKLSPGQDALDEGWTPSLAETPAFRNFSSLKYLLPLDSPRSHKL